MSSQDRQTVGGLAVGPDAPARAAAARPATAGAGGGPGGPRDVGGTPRQLSRPLVAQRPRARLPREQRRSGLVIFHIILEI